MAVLIGTAANDVMNGTTEADRMEGGAGNDRINAGAGDDEIFGGEGSDILTGDAGNDRIYGEDGNDGVYGGGGNDIIDGGNGDDTLIGDGGNDTIYGNVGNDRLFGGTGNDILEGGAGNDIINGEAGDDTIIWRSGDGSDTINGGAGNDTLEIYLSAADLTSEVRSDLAAYKQWAAGQTEAAGSTTALAAQTTGASFTFASLGLTISVLETVTINVDGAAFAIEDLINTAPVADAESQFAIQEDGVLEGAVAATDPDGDALTFTVEAGPANGTLTIDEATGAFVYTPTANASGADAFVVRISDPSGVSTTQIVKIDVAAVADAPSVSAANVEVVLAQPVIGTQSDDTITGNAVPEWATFALDIDAEVLDLDGSEALSIVIDGVPASAHLSAGEKQSDGSWLLSAADLSGLTMTAPTAVDLELNVTATAAEANGHAASSSATVAVKFDHSGIDNDVIDGSGGNDVIDGNTGNDILVGGAGDDTFIQRAGDGVDIVSGGEGVDTVELALSAADVSPQFLADLSAFNEWMEAGAQGSFSFTTIGLTVDTIEDLSITVDGADVSIAQLLNVAPVADAQIAIATEEDTPIEGVIEASDANGDALTFTIAHGPSSGTVEIDRESGAFAYAPDQNTSGTDSFQVRITDAFGESVVQTVEITIDGKADAPTVSVSDVVHAVVRGNTHTGTRGNDHLRGDQPAAAAVVALAIAAALTDLDGSEAMTIRIDGVPPAATLSAGVAQADGSWLLQPADLDGLTMTTTAARDIALTVTATSQDGNSVASSSAVLNVAFQSAANSLDDRFIATTGNDIYEGGAGSDTVDFASLSNSVDVDLADGTASGPGRQELISIENIVGTARSDSITGSSVNNVIDAGAGDDRVDGGAGDDILIGGSGHDRVDGGAGNDILIGGAGDDRYDGGSGYDLLDYSTATRSITVDDGRVSGMGNDRYSNIEKIVGSSFSDTFLGDRSVDVFDGGAGNDWFRGYKGSDVFTGGEGNDTFVWEERDVVSGWKSQGVDTITDFGAGDRLDLSDITGGFLGLNWLFGSDPASQVKVTDTAAGSMVSVKVGSSFYDVVMLQNVHGVTAASLLADGQLIA